jgi:hypothetical protein
MHVQGNQNPIACLEKKQSCSLVEQGKQLAQKVLHTLGAKRIRAVRDTLCAGKRPSAICFLATVAEPSEVIARRAPRHFLCSSVNMIGRRIPPN